MAISELDRAIAIVDQLQEWIESTDGLSVVPQAGLTYTQTTLSVFIGEVTVWDDQSRECELELEAFKKEYRDYVANFTRIARETAEIMRKMNA